MPAPLKPSRRRKLPQAPVSTEPKGSKSRGPPPKLPPRTSIGSKTTPEASTNTYASNTRLSSSSRYPLQSYAIAGTANTESAAAAAAAAAAVPSTLSTSTSNTTAGAAANPTSSKRPTLAQHKQKASSPSLAAAATTIVVEPQNLDRRQKTVAALVAAEQEYGRKLAIFEAVFGKIARTPETFAPLRDLLLTAPPLVSTLKRERNRWRVDLYIFPTKQQNKKKVNQPIQPPFPPFLPPPSCCHLVIYHPHFIIIPRPTFATPLLQSWRPKSTQRPLPRSASYFALMPHG